MKLAGSTWGASANTLQSSALVLCYSAAEYYTQSGHALLTQVRSMCSWTLPCASSPVPSILHLSHGFQCSPTLNRQPYKGRLPLTSWWRKLSNMTVGQSSLISLTPAPLLRLTSRKPLWLDLQPFDIKSQWRHNWKSAQVVNSHLVCHPTIRQPGLTSLGKSGLCWTVFAWNRASLHSLNSQENLWK